MNWVNIDKPTRKYTIHSGEVCTYVSKMSETPYKGINRLKRDGGWIEFDSHANAQARYQKEFAAYTLVEHC